MPGNLSWRVAKLESKAGSGHRMYHAVQGPKHCDVRRELADLGIEVEDNDLLRSNEHRLPVQTFVFQGLC